MTRSLFAMSTMLFAVACSNSDGQADSAPVPTMSVNDLMVTIVTPATDTLWGIEDPRSDEEWQVFIDAAEVVIDAGKTMKVGGTGPTG